MVVGTNGYLWPFKPIGTSGPRIYYIKSTSVQTKSESRMSFIDFFFGYLV